jgi:pSer/pThr/pTyr-binding forkhead associated (FHA) protein
MKMVLVPIGGGPPISLDKAIIFFGRGPECDIVLTMSRKVSRKHCCIAQIDDHFVVRDLGSMNGVRVNEIPVQGEALLNPGDILWVGDVAFHMAPVGSLGNGPVPRKTTLPRSAPVPAVPEPDVALPEEEDVPAAPVSKSERPAPGKKDKETPEMISPDEIFELRDSDVL